MRDEELADRIRSVVARLDKARVRPEATAEFVPAKRILFIERNARLRRTGAAWNLGAVLIETETLALLTPGTVTRSKKERRVGYVAESARERDALRWAAARGGFAEGEVVHVDPERLDIDALTAGQCARSGPLVLNDRGEIAIEWARESAPRPLAGYLEERATLLTEYSPALTGP